MDSFGKLYVVATPIGNLGDITIRAQKLLANVPVLACEDTRRTQRLLQHLQIPLAQRSCLSLHDQNEAGATVQIIDLLKSGQDVAVVSDAGTPLLSDPGYLLIKRCYEEGISTIPLPGASSLTAMISVCPISLNQFTFKGFLSRTGSARDRQLQDLKTSTAPTVFFESPHRLMETLGDLIEMGLRNRAIFVGREISKQFEEHLFDTVEAVHDLLHEREKLLGEFVVVVERGSESNLYEVERLIQIVAKEDLKPTAVSRIVSKLSGVDRKEVYALIQDSR